MTGRFVTSLEKLLDSAPRTDEERELKQKGEATLKGVRIIKVVEELVWMEMPSQSVQEV